MAQMSDVSRQGMHFEAAGAGFSITEFHWVGDSLISHARNVCVARFLESDCTDLFFLDSDVACGPGAISRMMKHPVDLVAGVYRVKSETVRYPVEWLDRPELWADPETGLLEARDVPFGFVRLTRKAIEQMVEEHRDDWFLAAGDDSLKCWPLFNTEVREHRFWGEDFYFCRKWRELGGRVWVDPEIPLQHIAQDGTPYIGHLGNWLRSR